MDRREFIIKAGIMGTYILASGGCQVKQDLRKPTAAPGVSLTAPRKGEAVFEYLNRMKGGFDQELYRQILGAANAFKEGDELLGVAADSEETRSFARTLLRNTKIKELDQHLVFQDEVYDLTLEAIDPAAQDMVQDWTLQGLVQFLLTAPEKEIQQVMPGLSSDVIGCVVKLMSNEELIQVSQKVFNPLPGSKIGSKGYLSARIQPNSPTDNIDDIIWQVFDAWSFAVGDLVLGTNPVSSEPESVARIEQALFDILVTFKLEDTLSNCVLSHIDIQAEVEGFQPGTTGIWFQSLAGTVNANRTFDVSVEKMLAHTRQRTGQYALYIETGQGADFTNGHGEGFDMVLHESRKYGFVRALKSKMKPDPQTGHLPWVHVNDVAGFIGPEVFKSKEQLVRCCLEDTLMGKLHGLPIGLDICSTLHMDVSLEDLDWCIEQVMPANPAYLMALPTKNDPMLSYLTTSFSDHVRIREQFGYKINDAMWDFFQQLAVIDANGNPTANFGDPIWVYYQYLKAKGEKRSKADIYTEGKQKIAEIQDRGVPIAQGYGENIWDLEPELNRQVHRLYEDAKESIWAEIEPEFLAGIPAAIPLVTQSADRTDYVYHPESGEKLSAEAIIQLKELRKSWGTNLPDAQLMISDGLNPRALMDDGHLTPFLKTVKEEMKAVGKSLSKNPLFITHGRVRAGYACGEVLFKDADRPKAILHIIGERPGSGHHNYSIYLTVADGKTWAIPGEVDHNITRVISGISDTALPPAQAAKEAVGILKKMFEGVESKA
ncbi:MAG: ethanolamine ammonia-lyase subunit EutB [Bacteroidota bacterium]